MATPQPSHWEQLWTQVIRSFPKLLRSVERLVSLILEFGHNLLAVLQRLRSSEVEIEYELKAAAKYVQKIFKALNRYVDKIHDFFRYGNPDEAEVRILKENIKQENYIPLTQLTRQLFRIIKDANENFDERQQELCDEAHDYVCRAAQKCKKKMKKAEEYKQLAEYVGCAIAVGTSLLAGYTYTRRAEVGGVCVPITLAGSVTAAGTCLVRCNYKTTQNRLNVFCGKFDILERTIQSIAEMRSFSSDIAATITRLSDIEINAAESKELLLVSVDLFFEKIKPANTNFNELKQRLQEKQREFQEEVSILLS